MTGVLCGGVQGFWVRKDIIITTNAGVLTDEPAKQEFVVHGLPTRNRFTVLQEPNTQMATEDSSLKENSPPVKSNSADIHSSPPSIINDHQNKESLPKVNQHAINTRREINAEKNNKNNAVFLFDSNGKYLNTKKMLPPTQELKYFWSPTIESARNTLQNDIHSPLSATSHPYWNK